MAQQQVGAVTVDADALFFSQLEQLVALAARYGLPAIYHGHEIARARGLMGYGQVLPMRRVWRGHTSVAS
jgi:hypothetical protein